MNVSENDIVILTKIQELDRVVFRDSKELKSLPQPAEAQKVHERYEEVSAKLSKVETMLSKHKRDFDCLEQEDNQLQERMNKVQGKIDSSEGDYRSVQTWSRDLEIMNDRRNVLGDKMAVLLEKISEIEAVHDQAAQGADALMARERDLYDQFKKQGNALKEEIARCQEASSMLAAKLDPALLKRYIAAVQRCGGVGLTKLEAEHCQACRNAIPANRMPEIRKHAPLAECPSCGRLLIIE